MPKVTYEIHLLLAVILAGLFFQTDLCAQNPLRLSDYFADPEPHQWSDGKMYLYCSHDQNPGAWCSDNYHVFSSTDLMHWTDNGISFQIPGAIIYACDCAFKDGTYYLYYATPNGNEFVASGKQPQGPFSQPAQIAGISGIDPAVFVDDDGQAYLYWGQLDNAHAAKLLPNMTAIDPSSVITPLNVAKDNFHEGSAMLKRNGTYYYVYADTSRRGRPTSLGYATGSTPLGPFTYRGVIIDSFGCDPAVWNDHGRIAQFNDRWYIFYHRSTHGGPFQRQICAEPITFNPDGTIPEVKTTSMGVSPPLTATAQIAASDSCELSGTVHTEDCKEGGLDLGHISNGDHAIYRFIDFGRGVTQFNVRVASDGTGGSIEIHLDTPTGTLIGKCPIQSTGDWQKWQTVNCSIDGATGIHELYLVFTGAGTRENCFNLRWFQFTN